MSYKAGTREFDDVMDLAARLFPDNAEANINAAAVALTRNDTPLARKYLERWQTDPKAYNNMSNADDVDGKSYQLAVSVSDSGFTSASGTQTTRATDNGYATTFTKGDQMGLYVVNSSNTVETANLSLTYDGTNWNYPTGTMIYYNSASKYFAYYPYQSTITDVPATSAATTAANFFSILISNWKPSTDQSSQTKYTASDLMIGTGTVGTLASNATRPITFNMAKRVKGRASAMAKPSIPIVGPTMLPVVETATNRKPMIGPVQEKETRVSVKAIKKMLSRPLVVSVLLSTLFVHFEGRVSSNAPKNEAAKTTNSRQNSILNTAFVANAFSALAPKISVMANPRTT